MKIFYRELLVFAVLLLLVTGCTDKSKNRDDMTNKDTTYHDNEPTNTVDPKLNDEDGVVTDMNSDNKTYRDISRLLNIENYSYLGQEMKSYNDGMEELVLENLNKMNQFIEQVSQQEVYEGEQPVDQIVSELSLDKLGFNDEWKTYLFIGVSSDVQYESVVLSRTFNDYVIEMIGVHCNEEDKLEQVIEDVDELGFLEYKIADNWYIINCYQWTPIEKVALLQKSEDFFNEMSDSCHELLVQEELDINSDLYMLIMDYFEAERLTMNDENKGVIIHNGLGDSTFDTRLLYVEVDEWPVMNDKNHYTIKVAPHWYLEFIEYKELNED